MGTIYYTKFSLQPIDRGGYAFHILPAENTPFCDKNQKILEFSHNSCYIIPIARYIKQKF